MKEGWEYKKLGEVCDLYQPKTISTKEMVSDGLYDVFGANGKIGKYHSYNHEDSEILMTCRGATCGNINISTPKSWINGNAMVVHIKDEEKLDRQFLVYSLINIDKSHIITGAAQPQITRQTLSPLQICFPSLPEQQSIVDYLDSAFAKIDAMKANAEKALNEAKALFQASLKEMLEPKEGWEENSLKDLTSKIGSGATPKGGRKVYIEKGCHLIRSMNVQYNEFKYDDLAHITEDAAEQLKGVEIQENDVLFNITGASIARCCVVPVDALPARVNQHVSILRLNQEVLPRFLSFILNSPQHQKKLLEIGEAGSTRQALTKTDLENHVISYPIIDKQVELISTLDSLKSKVDRLQENYDKISQECDALKQAILRQVFE